MVLGEGARSRCAAVAVAVVIAGVTASACSGGSGASPTATLRVRASTAATTTPTTSTSVPSTVAPGSTAGSASVTLPVLPVLPDAAKKATRPGAEAFYKYFLALYSASYATLDADALAAISLPTCKFCASTVKEIRGVKASGNRTVGGELTPVVVVAAPGDPTQGVLVDSVIREAASTTYRPDGGVVATVPADSNVRVDAVLVWVSGKWMIGGIEVLK